MTPEQLKKFNESIIPLKTDKQFFQLTVMGIKNYEIRYNDRDFKPGDLIMLKETEYTGEEMKQGFPLVYTKYQCLMRVSHVLSGYGLKDGWVILSVEKIGVFQDHEKYGLIHLFK